MKRALVGWAGDSAVLRIDQPAAAAIGELGMTAAEIWATHSTPPDLHAAADDGPWSLEPPPTGTVFRIITFAPGATSGLHQTRTLDYVVVISGTVSLLVGTHEVSLESGDVAVLNGASHDWINRSGSPCVIAATLLSAR